MKGVFPLAMKNLSRYRRRTIITASAVAIGLALYIVLDGMLLGLEKESERNLIWYETSSARVMTDEYWQDRERLPLDESITEPRRVIRRLDEAGIPATPRIVFSGELVVYEDPYPSSGSTRTQLYGIDPQTDNDVFRLRETVSEGRYLEPGENGALMGAWLAEDLGAEVGYPLTVLTRTREGYYQTIDLEIVGIVNAPNPIINRKAVYLPYDTAELYLQMKDRATEIDMSFLAASDYEEQLAAARAAIEAGAATGAAYAAAEGAGSAGDLVVKGWQELAAEYVALAKTKTQGSSMILFLVFVIAAVGVSNTMLMAVFERTRELGMMRALGMSERDVRLLFLIEAAGIGLIGAALGVAVGVAGNWLMTQYGIDYRWMFRTMDVGYRSAGYVRSAWHPEAIMQAFFIGIILAVAVSWVSTRRILKFSIPDSLHHQ
ncbi:MAG: FtsX-like permease family protein [Spirochaetes bacterium]|jgi:ABC-type lipoprotein release transport system permease subunit|nr:FtsX-like permease family protein [Spirochaetota bacterium]